ncbi:ABC transporter permease [Streptomyces sp. NPDC020096]
MSVAASVTARPLRRGPVRWCGHTLARGALEMRQFVREPQAVIFTFSFPLVLLLCFGAVFSGTASGTDIPYQQVFVSGIIAAGVMGSSFSTLGIGVSMDRSDGTLKRLRAMPVPWSTYFAGKVLMVLAVTVVQSAVLLAAGALFYGLRLPGSPGRWLTFGWVLGLGLVACSLTGLAVASLIRSPRAAPAVVTLPYVVLQFVSGVFFPFRGLPHVLQNIAAIFPLKWLCQGMRSVFLPDSYLAAEPAHSWEHGRTALVLAAWALAAGMLALRAFRRAGQER